jgi:hypothetical protein
MSSEPCKHERSDAILSFVAAVRDLARAEASLTRVRALCVVCDTAGQDAPTASIRTAMEGPT